MLKLVWHNIKDSPFKTAEALNNYIISDKGIADFTELKTDGNTQIFTGSGDVNLGDYFLHAEAGIIEVTADRCVTAQGNNCLSYCHRLHSVSLPALKRQGDANQSFNRNLLEIFVTALSEQGEGNQIGNNPECTAVYDGNFKP